MILVDAPKNLEKCLRGAPPACAGVCPFELDVRDLIGKIKRGNFDAAFDLYRNAVVFPAMVSQLCDAPCRETCVLKEYGDPICLKLLEQAVVSFGKKQPIDYHLPLKTGRVAIIGAGACGLACAVRLASKNFPVTVYDRAPVIGGKLRAMLPEELFLEEVHRESKYAPYTLRLNEPIHSLSGLDEDVILVATGEKGIDFGLQEDEPDRREGMFWGGEVVDATGPVESIAHGIRVAQEIEAYLISGGHYRAEVERDKRVLPIPSVAATTTNRAVTASNGRSYSMGEAKAEAARCIRCNCNICLDHCDLMQYYESFPNKLSAQVSATFNPDVFSPMNFSRMIHSCTMCGTCTQVCPVNVDMETFFLNSRGLLIRENLVSPVFHEFWLRDMDHANSSKCTFSMSPSRGNYVFFPGCQLGASLPEYVVSMYEFLQSITPGIGILLHCCSAPAIWSGDSNLFEKEVTDLQMIWEQLGKPILITACPNCEKLLNKVLENANILSLYRFLADFNVPLPDGSNLGLHYLFDSCIARLDTSNAVRELLRKMNVNISVEDSGLRGNCCSYGGGIGVANSDLATRIVDKRISQSELPFITYCANCRDNFVAGGKECLHILDIICQTNRQPLERPTVSERQLNRERLKKILQQTYCTEPCLEKMNDNVDLIDLHIPESLSLDMDRERILESDIRDAITHCEDREDVIIRKSDTMRICHMRIGNVTYWMHYKKTDTYFTLFHVYSHRMVIV